MTMAPAKFTRLLEQLGLSQTEAARRLKVADRTVRRWVAGDTAIPESVAMLLAVWLRERPSQEASAPFRAPKVQQTERASAKRTRKNR